MTGNTESMANTNLFREGLMVNETPDDDALAQCAEFGAGFAAF